MANMQRLNSEISATFSEIQYLIKLIHATRNTEERNLALIQLWNRTGHLKILVKRLKEVCTSASEQGGHGVQKESSIRPGATSPPAVSVTNDAVFTREELMQFTGKDGKPAYVAVDGVVYDVTNNAAWSLATHFGLTAGRDLTNEFASCHQGQRWILAQLTPVGRLG